MRHHFTPTKMPQSETVNNKCRRGRAEIGTLTHCCWECKMAQSLWETAWQFLKRINTELPYDTATALPDTHHRDESKAHVHLYMNVDSSIHYS